MATVYECQNKKLKVTRRAIAKQSLTEVPNTYEKEEGGWQR
jgi:hypothetical protein